ncbi:hypothetical protein ACOMHN_051367 [Nucella lapillus]
MEQIGDFLIDKKDMLGKGAFAIVYKGYVKKDPSIPVAVKFITKKDLHKNSDLLTKEIKVLRELSIHKHENLVALMDVMEREYTVFLMLEFCNGGDLADYLLNKGTLSEDALSSFMQQIASALKALYEKDVMHRDIKPQNILLTIPKGGNRLTTPPTKIIFKLADFGFARFLADGMMAKTLCGSPMYMAPEVIMSHKYNSKADVWSVGTILFQCLTGKAPFIAHNPQELRDFYCKHVDLKPKIPENTSPDLKDMLLRLLMRDPTKRIGIRELIEHPFLKKFRRCPSRRAHPSSPIPARCHTPSLSSESSSPGSNREISPLARQVCEVGDMVSTLTGSIEEDSGFTKVEKPDTRPHTPDDFVLVPECLPEYYSSGECRVRAGRAPLALAEEEYDAFDESFTSSQQPVRLIPGEGKVVFRRDEPSTSHLSSPVSSSPSPPLSQRSGGSSAPIPVPSFPRKTCFGQREGMGCGGGSKSVSPARVKKRSVSSSSADRSGDRVTGRRNSETTLAAPDITQVSPPAVQFNIGTPPHTGTWKRTNSLGGAGGSTVRLDMVTPAPPIMTGSPLRRSASCSPGSCFNPACSPYPPPSSTAATTPLPPSAPTHCLYHPYHPHLHHQQQQQPPYHHYLHHHHHLHHHPSHDPYTYHDSNFHRYPTVPDCTALVPFPATEEYGLEACNRCGTEPDLRSGPFNANHILRTTFTAHQQNPAVPGLGALLPWSGSRERLASLGTDVDRASPCPLEADRTAGGTILPPRRNSLLGEVTSQQSSSSLKFAAAPSPPLLEAALPCAAPSELSEDTLMDDEHNQTMARLRFILDVVDCVLTLARSRGATFNPIADSLSLSPPAHLLPHPPLPPHLASSQRLVEQLVLYLRALQMMSQSMGLARTEMKHDRLQYVASLRKVLNQQNEVYMQCIDECRKLYQQLGTSCKTPLTPQLIVNTADRLIYNYAVQQCQTAALDEVEGNKKECFQRYTTAQILLHSLAQLARNDHDRLLLEKYRHSVELRLSNMGSQSVHHPCPTWS